MNELQTAIKAAMDATEPNTKARNKALSSVTWRLKSESGLYAGLIGLRAALVTMDKAQVFDGRDNEAFKKQFYSLILETPLEVELATFTA